MAEAAAAAADASGKGVATAPPPELFNTHQDGGLHDDKLHPGLLVHTGPVRRQVLEADQQLNPTELLRKWRKSPEVERIHPSKIAFGLLPELRSPQMARLAALKYVSGSFADIFIAF
jgi:hypothetical protein